MFEIKSRQSIRLILFLFIALAFSTFTSFAQTGRTADVSQIVKNPDQYIGKEVAVDWKIDRVYSPTTIGLEKDEKHLLVIFVSPGAAPANMKEGDPINVTGMVRDFDRDQFVQQYGNVDFGKAPLHSFDHKPVLVVGGSRTSNLGRSVVPNTGERQKPAVREQESATTTTDQSTNNTALPRTASPLPLIGLVGLVAMVCAFSLPLFRRQ